LVREYGVHQVTHGLLGQLQKPTALHVDVQSALCPTTAAAIPYTCHAFAPALHLSAPSLRDGGTCLGMCLEQARA
jgi:hypothetical protein